jgi:thiol-disulfide isomerase/thioredoxin
MNSFHTYTWRHLLGKFVLFVLVVSLAQQAPRCQTIILTGFPLDNHDDFRYRHDSTIFTPYACLKLPPEGAINLAPIKTSIFVLCNYANGHAAYFDINHLTAQDTFNITYADYLSACLPYQYPLFYTYNSPLYKYVFKKYSGLNVKIYDIWRSVSRKKLKRAIQSGKLYDLPAEVTFEPDELLRLQKSTSEEAWLNLLPYCFGGNYDLIDEYLIHAGEKLEKIQGDTWDFHSIQFWSTFIFRTSIGPNLKNTVYREFEKIATSPFARYQRIKALCLAYNAVSAFGLEELNGGQFAISSTFLYRQLDSMPRDIYTKEFRRFLDSRAALTLDAPYEFADLNRDLVSIDSFLNKEWLILDFWATWCKPCIKSFPALKTLQEKYQEQAVLVSLSVDASHDPFAKWVQKRSEDYTWPFVHAGDKHPIIPAMKVIAYPTYMLVHVPSRKVSGPFYRVEAVDQFFSATD